MRTRDEAFEERFVAQLLVVLLQMLFRRCHELDGDELVAADGQCPVSKPPTMCKRRGTHPLLSKRVMISPMRPRCPMC